jgi:hypothetical protein
MAERAWPRILVGVLVLTAVAGASSALAGPAAAVVPAAADAKACGPWPSFPAGTANQIMAGQLIIAPFPAVTIDPHRDGDIGWTQNPFHNPTWEVDFQNGQWIEALVKAYLAGGPGAAAYRDRAQALLLGWVSHAALQCIPAPVVTMTRTGSSAAILTLIAPSAPGVPITAAVSGASRGWYRLRVQIGGRRLTFSVSVGGDIQAG